MSPNPIRTVLSSMRTCQVRCLLMGGQACVFYGAAEFSRDTDLALLASDDNLERFRAALSALMAEPVAVPPFRQEHLRRGHAVHFRCGHPDATGMRVDVMTVMRGVAPFEDLWERRTSLETEDGEIVDLMGLEDLVQAKKTQRDKDWPMLRRLVEANYFSARTAPTPERITFWLRELRTPALLLEASRAHGDAARAMADRRPLLAAALRGDIEAVAAGLDEEQRREQEADRAYWVPLKAELAAMCRARRAVPGQD